MLTRRREGWLPGAPGRHLGSAIWRPEAQGPASDHLAGRPSACIRLGPPPAASGPSTSLARVCRVQVDCRNPSPRWLCGPPRRSPPQRSRGPFNSACHRRPLEGSAPFYCRRRAKGIVASCQGELPLPNKRNFMPTLHPRAHGRAPGPACTLCSHSHSHSTAIKRVAAACDCECMCSSPRCWHCYLAGRGALQQRAGTYLPTYLPGLGGCRSQDAATSMPWTVRGGWRQEQYDASYTSTSTARVALGKRQLVAASSSLTACLPRRRSCVRLSLAGRLPPPSPAAPPNRHQQAKPCLKALPGCVATAAPRRRQVQRPHINQWPCRPRQPGLCLPQVGGLPWTLSGLAPGTGTRAPAQPPGRHAVPVSRASWLGPSNMCQDMGTAVYLGGGIEILRQARAGWCSGTQASQGPPSLLGRGSVAQPAPPPGTWIRAPAAPGQVSRHAARRTSAGIC